MERHESSLEYRKRTALYLKVLYIYHTKIDKYSSASMYKSFCNYALRNHLHLKELDLETAIRLKDLVTQMLKRERIEFNSNDLVSVMSKFNKEDPKESYMFYPDHRHQNYMVNKTILDYLFYKELEKESSGDENYKYKELLEETKDILKVLSKKREKKELIDNVLNL